MATPQPTALAARLIIPAYKYPSLGIWSVLAEHHPGATPGYVICNIAGARPGPRADSIYSAAITAAINSGWTILGYVDTGYAQRPSEEVVADICDWKSLYNVTSIFFDQVDSRADNVIYYSELMSRVRTADSYATVVINTGPHPPKNYLNKELCDAIIVFEGSASAFAAAPPPFYPRSAVRIGHIVHTTPQEDYQRQLQASVDLGASLIYVTDENDALYDSLPCYFAQENSQLVG